MYSFKYKNRYQITRRYWKLNGNTIAGYNNGHDSVGNRRYSENLVTTNKSEHFAFDNADRLTSFKTGTLNGAKDNIVAPTYSQSWNLDSIGNWAQFNDNGTNSVNYFSDTHEMTQFKGVTNTFDNNGNLTSDGVRTFKYDAFNRIIEVKVGVVVLAQYQYDAFNRRVMKKVDADLNSSFETTVKFLYDGFRCIEELNGSDALTKEYVYGSLYIDEVILQKAGLNEYYFTHDYRYSVTSLTDLIGNTVANYEYKVYGERTSSVNGLTDVGYTGQRHDAETGLMYFKNRYYSVLMGSFVTRDPFKYIDGMSMYLGYFASNKIDPSGLAEVDCKACNFTGKKDFKDDINDRILTHIKNKLSVKEIYEAEGKNAGGGLIPMAIIEKWLEENAEAATPLKTKYKGSAIDFLGTGGFLNKCILVCGKKIGTDKLGHMFQQGYEFYKIAKATDEAAAIEYGKWTEGVGKLDDYSEAVRDKWAKGDLEKFIPFGGFGRIISGVISKADIAANKAGMKLYFDIENGKFKSICDYISDDLNEDINLNEYTDELKKIVIKNGGK